MRAPLIALLLASSLTALADPLADVPIDELVVASAPPAAQREATIHAAKAFYAFWNTGDESLLKAALSPQFTDRTLPPGRPQGPQGPVSASKNFRTAVPDLRLEVRKMVVAGELVTVHLKLTGHFTGKFGSVSGHGQPIEFIATDLLKIVDGKITDNWHIEDNLALLTQMGVAKLQN